MQQWSYSTRVGVNNRLYKEFQTNIKLSWQCASCLFAILPNLNISSNESTLDVSPNECNIKDIEHHIVYLSPIHYHTMPSAKQIFSWFMFLDFRIFIT